MRHVICEPEMNQTTYILLVIISLAVGERTRTAVAVDFNAEVRPILSRACFPCHGPDGAARQGELRLDTRAGAFRTEKPVIMPGNSAKSLLMQRIHHNDPQLRMPPTEAKQQLTHRDRETLARWIDQGAVWGEHWSFLPLQRSPMPQVRRGDWSRNPIDDFVLARLEALRQSPSAPADRQVLLRRMTLDLVGLPPTLDAQAEFFADDHDHPDALERLVDRLLMSPHFGERWGRHWLDAARYADSGGFEGDPPRSVWQYRDWVLNAINGDLPFDQFVIHQLAGDLLPNRSSDDQVATGYLLNSQQDGGSEPARLDAVVDRTNTIGTVFLGLTIGCAQCHSHKFDPITQHEYYGLFAFINGADEVKHEFASPEQLTRRDALVAQVAALTVERTEYGAKLSTEQRKSDPGYQERTETIEQLNRRIPTFESALILQTGPADRVTTTFVRGEYARPGESVLPGVPQVLPPLPEGPRTRLEMARWLVSAEQPLTPRVTVNRVWQQLFGRGLVETENDFGNQGTRPTDPALLDWLAADFSREGWGFKRLMRRILESSVYRQSSYRRLDLEETDPENRLFARQARLRLEAELIRDTALSVSGLLSTKLGGPSVFPFQHDGIMINRATPAPWTISPGEDRYRRGLYTHYWRLTPHPQLQTFDAPDSMTACTRRQTSNTPLQALTLLNDPTFTEAAEHLARELLASECSSEAARVDLAVQLCLSRPPTDEERTVLRELLRRIRRGTGDATPTSGSQSDVTLVGANERTAWTELARTLLNLEEFLVRE